MFIVCINAIKTKVLYWHLYASVKNLFNSDRAFQFPKRFFIMVKFLLFVQMFFAHKMVLFTERCFGELKMA